MALDGPPTKIIALYCDMMVKEEWREGRETIEKKNEKKAVLVNLGASGD